MICWPFCCGPVVWQHVKTEACGRVKLLISWPRSKREWGRSWDPTIPFQGMPSILKTLHWTLHLIQSTTSRWRHNGDQAFDTWPLGNISDPNHCTLNTVMLHCLEPRRDYTLLRTAGPGTPGAIWKANHIGITKSRCCVNFSWTLLIVNVLVCKRPPSTLVPFLQRAIFPWGHPRHLISVAAK